MNQRIAHIALVVKDYDEAIEFYTKKLDFTLLEDKRIDEKKRWVMVAPPGAKECCLLLAKLLTKDKLNVSVIRLEDELDFFSLLMIFGEIITK
jgi:catechol 2,3-dioxygenase-like lactoylglutathione lyase family enzyme